jgi:hypothetical protein
MFGETVQHIAGERFEHALDELKRAKGVTGDLDLDAADLERLVEAFKAIVVEETGPISAGPARPADLGDPCGVLVVELRPRCSTAARSGSRTTWEPR